MTGLLGLSAVAQEGPGGRAWLEAKIRASAAAPLADGIDVRFETRVFRVLTDRQLADLERQVEENPEDLVRFGLEGERRRMEEGPDVTGVRLLWGGPDAWRFCTTRPDRGGDFVDSAVRGVDGWQFGTAQIQTYSAVMPPVGMEPWTRRNRFEPRVRALIHGPFSLPAGRDISVVEVDAAEDGAWRGVVEQADGERRWVLYGELRDGTVRVTRRAVLVREHAEYVEIAVSHFEPNFDIMPDVFRWRSRRTVAADGTLRHTLELLDAEPLDSATLRAALRTPARGEIDIIRGVVEVDSVLYIPAGEPLFRHRID